MTVASGFRRAGLALAVIAGSFLPAAVEAQTRPQPASSPQLNIPESEREACRQISKRDPIAGSECVSESIRRAAIRSTQSEEEISRCLRLVVAARNSNRIPDPGPLNRQNVCPIVVQYRLG